MIGDTDHGESELLALQHFGGARRLDIHTRAHGRDAGSGEVIERVRKRVLAVVEGVIVGERDAVDAEKLQRLDRDRRSSEEERLAGRRPWVAPFGYAAFEVEHEQVALMSDVDDLGREQRPRALGEQPFRDQAPEHRVAGECQPHHELRVPRPAGRVHGRRRSHPRVLCRNRDEWACRTSPDLEAPDRLRREMGLWTLPTRGRACHRHPS
jgi:hypothetical protein